MTPLADGGATVLPPEQQEARETQESCVYIRADGTKQTTKHRWVWMWDNGEWTNKVRCTTCGRIRETGV